MSGRMIWSSGTAALTAPAPSGRRTLVGLESEPIETRSAGAQRRRATDDTTPRKTYECYPRAASWPA